MPIDVERREGVLVMRLRGAYGFEEWFDALDQALDDLHGHAARALLCDMTDAAGLTERSPADMQRGVTLMKSRGAHFSYRAAAVASGDLHYGLMRMAEAFAFPSELQIRVFRAEERAWDWLRSEISSADDSAGVV